MLKDSPKIEQFEFSFVKEIDGLPEYMKTEEQWFLGDLHEEVLEASIR